MKKFTLLFFVLFMQLLYSQNFQADWVYTYGGTDDDVLGPIAVDASNNVYIAGVFHDTVNFDNNGGMMQFTSNGDEDIIIEKLDQTGNLLWAKRIGGGGPDYPVSLAIDSNQNLYIAGFFTNDVDFDPGNGIYNLTANGMYDNFILKLDPNGDFLWAKSFGSTSIDILAGMDIDSNDNLVVTGTFKNTMTIDTVNNIDLVSNGGYDIYVIKYDSDGNLIWGQNYGAASYDKGRAVSIDSNDNIIVSGIFKDTVDFDNSLNVFNLISEGAYDVFILKLDANGSFVWVQQFGGTQNLETFSVINDANDNVYITGYFYGTATFDYTNTEHYTSAGSNDDYLSKLDPNGNHIWTSVMSNNDSTRSYCITMINNILYVSGYFKQDLTFTHPSGFATLTSNGENDIFVASFDPNSGYWLNVKNYGGTQDDKSYYIVADNNNNLYLTGFFKETPSIDSYNLTSNGLKDALLIKFGNVNTNISNESPENFTIYPNPVQTVLNIKSHFDKEVSISISDLSGKILFNTKTFIDQNFSIPVNLSNGIYFVKLKYENQTVTKKIMVKH